MRWWTLFLLWPALAMAVPVELTHSGRILDAAGGGIDDTATLTFTLYDASNTALYAEDQEIRLNDGYYAALIGPTGQPALDSDVFDGGDLFIEVAVDGQVFGTRSRIASVPYAVRSETAGHALTADAATTAGSATTAQSAVTAQSADTATTATTATNLDGGTVNATEISVNDTVVIDSSGNLTGPAAHRTPPVRA